ncbi:MAG: hypothetical protein WDW36_003139 [Sanguina aurantia]
MQGSVSARDESDSHIVDGDEHDPSMERSSGVVAASTLRLFERNTQQQQQQLDASLQGLVIMERLGSNGRCYPAVRADSGSLSGARTQRQYSTSRAIQRTASNATDSSEVRSSLPPHFHLPTEQQQQNASVLQHAVSLLVMPHALSRPTSAAPIRTAFSATMDADHIRQDYGPRSPDRLSRAQPLDAAEAQNSNRPPASDSRSAQDAQAAHPLTRSRSASAAIFRLTAQSFSRRVVDDPPPSQASSQVSSADAPAHTQTPVSNALEDHCQGNLRPCSAESSSCRPSWTGSTPLQLPAGPSRAGLGSACLTLSQSPLSAETAAQRQLSSRGSGRAGSTGPPLSTSPSFLVATLAQVPSSPHAGNSFSKLPLLMTPIGSGDGTHGGALSSRDKSRSGSVTDQQVSTRQPATPTSAHAAADSNTPRSTTNDTHVIPFTVSNSGNNDSSGSGGLSNPKHAMYSPNSAAALLLAAAAAFDGCGLPQQPQQPSNADSSSARATAAEVAAEVAAAVLRQSSTSVIELEAVQQVPYIPSLLEQQQQRLVLPPPAYLQAKRRASMPSTQLPKYTPSYAVDAARRQQHHSHMYREMEVLSANHRIPLLEDEPSYCSTVANEAVVEDPGRVPASWSMELEQDLLASLPPPQYHRRTCAATTSGYVSDAMMEDRPRHWATDNTAAAADEEAAARNAAGFEQRMFNLLPHAKYDRGSTSTSSGGGVARSSAAAGGRGNSDKAERSLASALIANGQSHLFSSWPRPGVRDDVKRRQLHAISAHVSGTSAAPGVETARLAALLAPLAAKVPKQLVDHGDTREDSYYWLRDDDRKDPKVLAHLAAETAYTKAALADTEALQAELYTEMRARIQEEDQGVPYRRAGFYYYTRTVEGLQYRLHCRRRVPEGAGAPCETDSPDPAETEEVILDENRRKEDGKHTFYMTGGDDTSPDHKLLAWTEDTVGGEKYTLHVKDLSTGAEIMEPIPETSGDFTWANDNKTLFYVMKDHLDRPYKVLRHLIGSPSADDVVVFEETDDAFYVGIGRSRSDEMIMISCGSAVTSETRFINANSPTDEFKVVMPRVNDVEYSVYHRGDSFYMTYRDASTPNSEVRTSPVAEPAKCSVLIQHSASEKIEGLSLSAGFLVLLERHNGLQQARLFPLPSDGSTPSAGSLGSGEVLEMQEAAYSLDGGCTGDFDSPLLRLHYTSLTTPASVIDHHMGTGSRCTKKVAPVLGGFLSSNYTTERQWATSQDGTKVPISIVYRKGAVKLDGSDPMLLNGYGSYEISNDPYFTSQRLTLLDRGFVFAIAHTRGGGEMGRQWYEDGKFLKKKNTFLDFIAVAEHLVAEKYTSHGKMCIEGRSAGGLLVGAVVTMRPELFHAAIAGVPFVDALTTMLDETIPLTIVEWEEWGQPRDPEFYAYMKSYSPIDNITPKAYPNLLATGGLHDPRVAYWEPAKLIAKLRENQLDGSKLVLLKCDMGAGHFSVTGRFEKLKETAFEYAFLLKTLGMMGTKTA